MSDDLTHYCVECNYAFDRYANHTVIHDCPRCGSPRVKPIGLEKAPRDPALTKRNASEKAQTELDAILDKITHHPSRLIEISVSVELHRVCLLFGFTSEEIEVEISTDPEAFI